MGKVIAGTYEIEREIGSGGGGVVYLGRHLRLGKQVVLKADKRKLSAKPETLRREVDALKNLSHTYIPQVYDFVAEEGVVYTIMDYIEGESLDKPLNRGVRYSQEQVVQWSCQLLEALAYLHDRPPYGILHGDLKPANVMLTPQGDIRLIDFNIALALGEEGAVQVGFSRGYASPEHYGLDYRTGAETQRDNGETQLDTLGSAETQLSGEGQQSSVSGGKPVRLDVRSDVYSLGATLYHLLCGEKPIHDAREVIPLAQKRCCSAAVAAIIDKAMAPDPDKRYQTAREMLYDFEHLHENDPRAKRHKRRRNVTAAALAVIFLAGVGMTVAGLGQMERAQASAAQTAQQAEAQERREKDALAAVRAAEAALEAGDIPGAKANALAALAEETPYLPQAQTALTKALGLYDLSDGLKAHCTVELPTELLKLTVSPEGGRAAALHAYSITLADLETGSVLAELPAQKTAAADFAFVGEDVLLYAGESGLTAYDIPAAKALWTGERATRLTVSENGKKVAGVYERDGSAIVYDVKTGAQTGTVSFGGKNLAMPAGNGILADPEDTLFALNEDGTLLAASFEGGGLALFDVRSGEAYEIMDASDYARFEGGFFGKYFAFSAWNGRDDAIFLIYDTAVMDQLGGFSDTTPIHTASDSRGICLSMNNLLVELDPETLDQREMAYTSADITAFRREAGGRVLVATRDNGYALFNANAQLISQGEQETGCELLNGGGLYVALGSLETPTVQVLKLENHAEAQLASYDPTLSHQEARLSADRTRVMLFGVDAVHILDTKGNLLQTVQLQQSGQIYDQQYRRTDEGSYLEVTWHDGTARAYSAEDGSLLWEKQGAAVDESLQENFETSRWRIEAPLHGAAQVYDRETGALFTELEQDSFLTYVTEVEDHLVTQYVSAQGEHYGLLLDQDCRTQAYLPGLCDVLADGTLIFDDDMGNLRQSRIYSLEELKDLAK